MKALLFSLLALAALSGCSQDACEAAVSIIQERAEECGLLEYTEIDAPNSDGTGRQCTADDDAVLTRQAECTQNAPCGALDGSDVAGNKAYAECLAGP